MDVIFTKEFVSAALCILIVLSTLTCSTVFDISRKLNLIEEYLKYNSNLLEKIKSMLEKKGF